MPKQEFDHNPELIQDFALLVENNPESFKEGIEKILSDEKFQNKMIQDGLNSVKKINSDIMEEKERDLYLKITKD